MKINQIFKSIKLNNLTVKKPKFISSIILGSVLIACNVHAQKVDTNEAKKIAFCAGVLFQWGHTNEQEGEFKNAEIGKKQANDLANIAGAVLGVNEFRRIMKIGITNWGTMINDNEISAAGKSYARCDAMHVKLMKKR